MYRARQFKKIKKIIFVKPYLIKFINIVLIKE